MESEHAPQISDTIMAALLQMFQSSVNNKTGGVQEDALMAVGTLVEVLGDGFAKYMEAFKPFLLIGLKNIAEYQVGAAVLCIPSFSVNTACPIPLSLKVLLKVFLVIPLAVWVRTRKES